MSFFRNLRITNKRYPNLNAFNNDYTNLIRPTVPSGFNMGTPSGIALPGGQVQPGFNINNNFVSNAQINRVMRNNDVSGIRNVFPGASNNNIRGLDVLRRTDNVPDPSINRLTNSKDRVKNSFPETSTRTPQGVDNALQQNPRLMNYLRGAGGLVLIGVGVYLVVNVADLVGSIVEALNRTGGSYLFVGNNGADTLDRIETCILRYRSCGMMLNQIDEHACKDEFTNVYLDPILTEAEGRAFCNGYSLEREQSVCRGSDANADPTSLQYFDIADLDTNMTIQCLEPYDFGDLIADLGLDGLLGENGLLTNVSGSLTSFSDNFMTILFVLGGIVLLLFIGFVIFKMTMSKKT
jgi:hypothetical protein